MPIELADSLLGFRFCIEWLGLRTKFYAGLLFKLGFETQIFSDSPLGMGFEMFENLNQDTECLKN